MKEFTWIVFAVCLYSSAGVTSTLSESGHMDPLAGSCSSQVQERTSSHPTSIEDDVFVSEVATSYGLSVHELEKEAISFIEERTTRMHERKQHTSSDQPSSIDDLILIKKPDPIDFVDKFNAFLRSTGQAGNSKVADFDFNYPQFLVPLDSK